MYIRAQLKIEIEISGQYFDLQILMYALDLSLLSSSIPYNGCMLFYAVQSKVIQESYGIHWTFLKHFSFRWNVCCNVSISLGIAVQSAGSYNMEIVQIPFYLHAQHWKGLHFKYISMNYYASKCWWGVVYSYKTLSVSDTIIKYGRYVYLVTKLAVALCTWFNTRTYF